METIALLCRKQNSMVSIAQAYQPKEMQSIWIEIIGTFISAGMLLFAAFGFIWNAREKRKERKEKIFATVTAKREKELDALNAALETKKDEWAEAVRSSVSELKDSSIRQEKVMIELRGTIEGGTALQKETNKTLFKAVDDIKRQLETIHVDLKSDIKSDRKRIEALEREK